nr:hypothetical protein [Mycobacterium sp. 155]
MAPLVVATPSRGKGGLSFDQVDGQYVAAAVTTVRVLDAVEDPLGGLMTKFCGVLVDDSDGWGDDVG